MERGEGERLHAAKRRRFWLLLAALGGIGFIGGIASRFIRDFAHGGASEYPEWLATLAAAGVVATAVLAVYGSWRFFVTVDEVELADNLWGSLIGFYAYAVLLPVWWALSKLERAPEPDHWIIYGAAMVTAIAAYLYRKWCYS